MIFSRSGNLKKKYFQLCPRNWSWRDVFDRSSGNYFSCVFRIYLAISWTNLTLYFLTWCNHATQVHPSFGKVKGKGKISPDQWMEKLKMRNLSWSMNGLEIFKVLNWLMSQYRKTIVAEFFFYKTHSPVLEMIFFWK